MIIYGDLARVHDAPTTLESRMLVRFVLISMLVHALMLLVFGTSGGRSAQRDDAPWGGLDVTLRRLSPEPGSGMKLVPGEETTLPGASLLRRLGAAPEAPPAREHTETRVEPAVPPPPPAMPGVAPAEPAAVPDAGRPQENPQAAPPSAFDALPPLNRSAPEVVDRPYAPVAPASPPSVDAAPAPTIGPKPRENSDAPVSTVAPAPPERPVAPSIETPLRETPTPPSTPPTVERTAPPKVETAPAAEAPLRETPAIPAPQPLAPVAPPKVEREVAPAVEAPRETPVPLQPPIELVAPPTIEPKSPPQIEVPAQRRAPVDASAPSERAAPPSERAAPPQAAPGKAQTPSAPSRTERPGEQAPRLRFGAPDPGDEIFKPRGDTAPTAEPDTAPRLDLEATRQRAREIAGDGSAYRGFVPAIPPPPPVDRKSKLADAIEKAQKPDCRDAYAAMGLLAVPALVVSTVGNGGCRW